MRIHLWLASFLILTLGNALPIHAQNTSDTNPPPEATAQIATGPRFDVALGVGRLRGDTRYQIGGVFTRPDGSTLAQPDPTSELIWPLDVYMAHLNANVLLADRIKLGLGVKKNIRESAGKMEDSDWGIYWLDGIAGTREDTLDIYSESSTDLDALMWDATAGYMVIKNPSLTLTGLIGYRHQHLVFDAYNCTQWYPSYALYTGNPGGYDYTSGKVIAYKITYQIPYLGLETTWNVKDTLQVQANLGYSPYAMVEDKDHHFIGSTGQGSTSRTDTEGQAWMYGIHGTAFLSKHWALDAGYDVLEITARGDSEIIFGGYEDEGTYSIREEIESTQKYLSLSLKYEF